MSAAAILASPLGELRAEVDESGSLTRLSLPALRATWPGASGGKDSAFDALREELAAYFDGTLRTFSVPLALKGTPFQVRVWELLLEIPYGETWTYGALAARLGEPGAAQAVGAANGQNPVAIVVPCHRVIGANGSLTGYAGGLEAKQALLRLEAPAIGLFA